MSQTLPIFELPIVLLPEERIPLHIFEERYKRMIERAIATGEPFGILLNDDAGARAVGCTAYVTELLERYEDGRLDVVVTGGEPFRVLDRFDTQDDPSAETEIIDETLSGAGGGEAADPARRAFIELAERASGERPDAEQIAGESAYGLAGRVELPAETKQELLQLRDEETRMKVLAAALRTLLRVLDESEDAAERASSNGKVRIGPQG
jgi:Lon protease-like protein